MLGWLLGSKIKKISTSQLKQNYLTSRSGKFFLDVRTPAEFRGCSIPAFTNIPLQNLSSKLHKIPKDREVVVICQSGMRSSMACRLLKKSGYERVTNVSGGINHWV